MSVQGMVLICGFDPATPGAFLFPESCGSEPLTLIDGTKTPWFYSADMTLFTFCTDFINITIKHQPTAGSVGLDPSVSIRTQLQFLLS